MSSVVRRRLTRARAWAWLLAAAPLAAACESPTIPGRLDAYDFRLTGGIGAPLVLRWPAGATVRVFVAPDPAVMTDNGTRQRVLVDALDAAAGVWNHAVLYREFRLERVTRVQDADVLLLWSDDTGVPVETSACQPQLIGRAVTTFCLDSTGVRLHRYPLRGTAERSSVRMLVTMLAQEAGNAERVQRLVAHELGHVLGIGQHSLAPDDLMTGGPLTRADLSPADRATVQVLYHTDPDVRP